MVARVESGISDQLATSTQHSGLWHLHQQRGRQRLTDTADAEQQVTPATQFCILVDCLANGPIDGSVSARATVLVRLRAVWV